MPPIVLQHRLVWFKPEAFERGRLDLAHGGERREDDRLTWEMSELARLEYGANLDACVPAIVDLPSWKREDLPDPGRCLEIFSEERLSTARGQQFKIKDIFGFPKVIPGEDFIAYIEGFRQLWREGHVVIRLPKEGSAPAD